jgi:epoxyqueuosine reductase QueG
MNAQIRESAAEQGIDIVGFADLRTLPPEYQTGYPFGVCLAISLDRSVISRLEDGPTKEYYNEYSRVNALLDAAGEKVAGLLKSEGYDAVCIPATSSTIDTGSDIQDISIKTLSARISHKMIATRAGLGWIGKSDLLVTREFGTAVRLISVLTDCPLTAGTPSDESDCGDCRACVDACPAGALKGETWYAGISREVLMDVESCRKTTRELTQRNFGEAVSICGKCIIACPWTKKYLTTRP